ncbi:family 43 glycosylhydrolase [Catellatospora sp. KI3]|uniref:family 43 glycosylhydrolase n=1 Tax=Catellatospora sp. KI3 TaxID=3041620 RepID=UPI0024821CC7|nr:family 43 glycosylhydrolase [Catellatospora sp. KI3]MDI1466218.1 family 43 glycosylhydrolase [Catellatospora sp. KI3]
MTFTLRRASMSALALVLSLACLAVVAPRTAHADNPIVQHIYTADPAPLVYNGRVYLYTGHDEDNSTYFTMRDWRVWSSADMVNWTDHGSPMSLSTFSWAGSDAWAGQAVYRNGKFYWYVPVRMSNGTQAIGVGVADSPTGPFRDALGRPLIQGSEIDPTVYIDTDGQAYLYYGNPRLWYVRLNADMISYSGSPTQIPLTTSAFGTRSGDANRPTLYEEGPWFYKRNNLYYMVFAAKCCSEFIAYSTSTGPTGPWTYRGTVMPTQGGSFTNHPGVIDFNGGSYFFYHNGALPGGGGYTRSVAVEKFNYNSDGTIPTINMTTTGAPQVGTLDPYVRQEAETIAWGSGIETEAAGEGGMNIGWLENGDYVKVKGVAFGTGASSFTARVASGASGGRIEARLDSATGTTVASCTVAGTGGWQTWTTVSCPVTGATGTHDLYLRFTGGSGYLFNVNWWQFTTGQATGYPTGYRSLVIGNNGLCVDVSGGSTAAGAAVVQNTCGSQTSQKFQFVPVSGGYGRLQAQHSGYDVAVANSSTAAGVLNIVQQAPNSAANSLWLPVAQSDGSYSFRNQNSGLCLDGYGANSTVGQQLDQWQCKNAPGNNQDFSPR